MMAICGRTVNVLRGRPAACRRRAGFTATETVIGLAVLAGAAAMLGELASQSLAVRARADARLEAVDTAANVLEEARVRPWSELTPEWAAAQKLPESLTERWPDMRLSVRVEPEANRPRVKRVTVEIKWTGSNRAGWPPVTTTGLFAARAAEGKP